jgi:hypothetical protein
LRRIHLVLIFFSHRVHTFFRGPRHIACFVGIFRPFLLCLFDLFRPLRCPFTLLLKELLSGYFRITLRLLVC